MYIKRFFFFLREMSYCWIFFRGCSWVVLLRIGLEHMIKILLVFAIRKLGFGLQGCLVFTKSPNNNTVWYFKFTDFVMVTCSFSVFFSAGCCPLMESLNPWSVEDTTRNPVVSERERATRTVRESTTLRWPERYLSYQGHKDKIHGLDVKMR